MSPNDASRADERRSREFVFSDADFSRVRDLIHRRAGIAIAPAKKDMVYSRLCRRLRALGLTDFDIYLDRLARRDDSEWEAFTNALTTNLTSFFRESHHFDWLAGVLRGWRGARAPRIWCSAASTGEEPYSIAMIVAEASQRAKGAATIVATDVDTGVLERARAGIYVEDRIAGLSDGRRRRFFLRGTGPNTSQVKVRPELADMLDFRALNLIAPAWPLEGCFDVIFCRNVMIYFDKPTQQRILERMHKILSPGGWLVAGHSESYLNVPELFTPCGHTIYARAGRADEHAA